MSHEKSKSKPNWEEAMRMLQLKSGKILGHSETDFKALLHDAGMREVASDMRHVNISTFLKIAAFYTEAPRNRFLSLVNHDSASVLKMEMQPSMYETAFIQLKEDNVIKGKEALFRSIMEDAGIIKDFYIQFLSQETILKLAVLLSEVGHYKFVQALKLKPNEVKDAKKRLPAIESAFLQTRQYTFTSGGDERGVISSLGVDKSNFAKSSENSLNPWIRYDMGPGRSLIPYHYKVYQRKGFCYCRNWRLEGSNDGFTWVTLRDHYNENSVTNTDDSDVGIYHFFPNFYIRGFRPCASGSWPVSTSYRVPYRFFRIIHLDPSSNGYEMFVGLELYGKFTWGGPLYTEREIFLVTVVFAIFLLCILLWYRSFKHLNFSIS